MSALKVGTWLHHWFPRTYHQNKYYTVHTYPYVTLLTHKCPLLPVWPQSVAKVLPQPVLLTQHSRSLPLLTFLLFCKIIQKRPKNNTFLLFYHLQNSKFVFHHHFYLFLPSTTCLSHQSLRRFLATSLAKYFMKQDLVLLVTCHSLTNQLVTCHTHRFVKQTPEVCWDTLVTFYGHYLMIQWWWWWWWWWCPLMKF